MAITEIAKQLRSLLSKPAGDEDITSFLGVLDDEILRISTMDDAGQQQRDFEEELQVVFDENVDYSRLQPAEIFLEVLIHSRPILPTTTFISNWFDLLLRPTLREPRLASSAVKHAKQLVIESMENDRGGQGIVANFRRRLLDLYLLDVLNESSGKDIIEWAQLDDAQKEKNSWWKTNLKDILISYGLSQPEELMDVMQECFVTPSSRLQIVSLLDILITQPSFSNISTSVFPHPFMASVYRSLEVDNSSTVCAVELALLVKLLPTAALKAYGPLKDILPRLFGILGRVLCWKSRGGQAIQTGRVPYSDLLDYDDNALLAEVEKRELSDEIEDIRENWQTKLQLREDLDWKRLDRTFDMSTSSLPVPRQFFVFLYFLFPCNTVNFLRSPIAYLQERGVESPWTVAWEDALNESQIRTAGDLILRTQLLHPSILWHDVQSELKATDRWSSYDLSKIVGKCMMLDSHMSSLTSHRNDSSDTVEFLNNNNDRGHSRGGDITMTQTPTVRAAQLDELPSQQQKVSLNDIIATSAALKLDADVNLSDKAPIWPSFLFTPPPSTAPSRSGSVDPSLVDTTPASPTDEPRMPVKIGETVAGLQREVLLLRTELNLELWLKRENVRHIGRLHTNRVVTKNEEFEQQRLQDRLREYRIQLLEREKELKQYQDQAVLMKGQHIEWDEERSSKLRDLREQKKKWEALHSAKIDLEARLTAQSKLLDEAHNRVSELNTQIKDDAPKVQRLRDYEKRIEQLTAMHRMWNKDIDLYNQQSRIITELVSEHQKMKLRVEQYEKAQEEAEATDLANHQRIQSLEARLREAERCSKPRPNGSQMLAVQAAEQDNLKKSNAALRAENDELREEMDELRAMVEVLKAGALGATGLVDRSFTSTFLQS